MGKALTINTRQGELFADPVPQPGFLGSVPVVYGEIGSHVDLEVRAEHLIDAINAFNKRASRKGFDTASNDEQYDAPIWARYKRYTSIVQTGAKRNEKKFKQEAKEALWKATGYIALRRLKRPLASRHQMDARARKIWHDFKYTYGGRGSGAERQTYKKVLQRSIKMSQQIKKDLMNPVDNST